MTQTLASLHKQHETECVSYPQAVSLAKAGTLPGVSEYRMGFGWIVEDEVKALKAIKHASKVRKVQ